MHRTARASVLGALALAWCGISLAQSPSASQAPKPGDRVAEMVALDFYAATPDGSPVAGLKAEEVQVRIDGRPRALKWLEWFPWPTRHRNRRR